MKPTTKSLLPLLSELYLEGYIRVIWVGKLSKTKEGVRAAYVKVYWMEIEVDKEGFPLPTCHMKPNTHIKQTDLPIGCLTLVFINAIFRRGVLVAPWGNKLPIESEEQHTLDFSPGNLTLFNRRDKGEIYEHIVSKSDRLRDLDEANSSCISVKVGDDPFAIIFPCAEILRFFYCTSSTMANALFNHGIEKPSTHLFDPERSSFSDSGEVFITLRKKMLDSDARLLASIFTDPEIVLRNAQRIASEASKSPGEYRNVIAFPPFEGRVDIQYAYVAFSAEGKERRLVTRILKSYHAPKFLSVQFTRELNAPTGTGEDEGDASKSGTTSGSSEQPPEEEPITLENGTFADAHTVAEIRKEELARRFPEVEKIACVKKLIVTETTGKKKKNVPKKSRAYSTAQGSRQDSDEELGAVNIHSGEEFPLVATETTNVNALIGGTEYKLTILRLSAAQNEGYCTVRYVHDVLPHFKVIEDIYFNAYAIQTDRYHHRQPFHLIERSPDIGRLVLIAKISSNNRTRFLVDFQQRIPNEVSYQVFWFVDESVPADFQKHLGKALELFARTKYAGGNAVINMENISWGWFKHKIKGKNPPVDWIVNEVFNADDRITTTVKILPSS